MKKIEDDQDTAFLLTGEEARDICCLGQGEKTCAFLGAGGDGFVCLRMIPSASGPILDRLEKGEMKAKGVGGWKGCAWEGSI